MESSLRTEIDNYIFMKQYNFAAILILVLTGFFISSCVKDDPDDEIRNASTLFLESEYETICGGETKSFTLVRIQDRGRGIGTMTMSNDKTYILQGLVYVNSGQTLTIEPGTVIKGESGQGSRASALIVAKGGKIIAEGTQEQPIIFTAFEDVIYSHEGGLCDQSALTNNTKGLWGGVIIMGDAPVGRSLSNKRLDLLYPIVERVDYGGDNSEDNSGILQYISIRHSGTQLISGFHSPGLTLAGVGNGTTVNNIEVYASDDDGFKWFGGTVNTQNLVATYCRNDAMDYTEGWTGKNQFWFAMHESGSDHSLEGSGNERCLDCAPLSVPTIANATFVGYDSNNGAAFINNAGGYIYNSIFDKYKNAIGIEYTGKENDSYNQFLNGKMAIEENIFSNISEEYLYIINETKEDVADKQSELTSYLNDNNFSGDAELHNFVPQAGSAADNAGKDLSSMGLQSVNYKGAFEVGKQPWFSGWTRISKDLD